MHYLSYERYYEALTTVVVEVFLVIEEEYTHQPVSRYLNFNPALKKI